MSKIKGPPATTDDPTEKRQLTIFEVRPRKESRQINLKVTIPTKKTQPSRYKRRLANMAEALGPKDGKRFVELDERFSALTPGGLSNRERDEYYYLRGAALVRLI